MQVKVRKLTPVETWVNNWLEAGMPGIAYGKIELQEPLLLGQPPYLLPSYHGEACLGNGRYEVLGYSCQCRYCEALDKCFPECNDVLII